MNKLKRLEPALGFQTIIASRLLKLDLPGADSQKCPAT